MLLGQPDRRQPRALIDQSGGLQWASGATASSTYAQDPPPVPEAQGAAPKRHLYEVLTEGSGSKATERIGKPDDPLRAGGTTGATHAKAQSTEELTRRMTRLEETVRELRNELEGLKK